MIIIVIIICYYVVLLLALLLLLLLFRQKTLGLYAQDPGPSQLVFTPVV